MFVLIHGASSAGFYWDRVTPLLREAGHAAIAPDLPIGEEDADFSAYAAAAEAALAEQGLVGEQLIIVGQSLGGFTAPVVAAHHPGSLLVLLAPMIPAPGETPAEWMSNVGLEPAQQEAGLAAGYDPAFDVERIFLHDVPTDLVRELMQAGEPQQAESIFGQPFPLEAWPDVRTVVIACTEDRMFPLPLVTRAARDRLGVEPRPFRSGHLPAFGHPEELARELLAIASRATHE